MAISTDVYTLEWLRHHSSDELVELWRTLEAPTLEEMYGEYQGHMIFPLSIVHAKIRKEEGPGEWFGKAFAPIPHGRFPGQGYTRGIGILESSGYGWSAQKAADVRA